MIKEIIPACRANHGDKAIDICLKSLLPNNTQKPQETHSPRGKFRTNFQVVGAGSAYNRPGQHQRRKRAFWVLFGPTKSTWRVSHMAKQTTEIKRDIPQPQPFQNPSHNTQKNHMKPTSPGENSGRIFRLSAPGAPTTDPDHTKEQKGLSGHSLALQRVSGAHHATPKEPQNSSATYLSRTKIHM
ncbi:hypothetical protein CAG70_06270 [Photobacterium halotolerans]|uniref:hypothetical protein n=1 Tax=Photobacterium halotolerans TaxID=265726 RepID=UPI00137255B6|nr:hypothetical protein [Photobacterium halotolerans]NAX46604.1 hypothetical protein [Photobacterium halotolerans]